MKKLIFDTKENNNERRRQDFLALTPPQRFEAFLKMMSEFQKFPNNAEPKNPDNFIFEKK